MVRDVCRGRHRRCPNVAGTISIALLLVGGASVAAESRSAEPELAELLSHLNDLADLFRDNALRFACEETITYARTGSRKKVFRLDYIYVYENERMADYRTRRGGSRKKASVPVEPSLYGLPYFLERAYSWVFIFERAKRDIYRYEILGDDKAQESEAVVLRFEPVPPYQKDLNDWFGTAWIDRKTYQILKVEALKAREHAEKQRFEAALRTPPSTDEATLGDYTFTTVSTEFSVEEGGLRLPTRAVAAKTRYRVRDGKRSRAFSEHPVFRVTQEYRDYRFFGVRTLDRFSAPVNPETTLEARPCFHPMLSYFCKLLQSGDA